MPPVIRRADVRDARDIAHIHVIAWQTAYRGIVPQPFLDALDEQERTRDWTAWLDNAEGNVHVAEQDGQLRGFIAGGKLREPVAGPEETLFDAELYALYLLPSAAGHGIGRLLTQRLAGVLLPQGFRSLAVWVLAANPARDFYAHLGATQIAGKTVRIGDAELIEVAYGWQDMKALTIPA